ncbi:hypothetical protein SAMN05216219_2093 [Mycetocola miduiensis]|uniref:Uncharacterized protein n=1 Tax=Mycetocola miduiensis TaxID=995034 RepID=A0A1I5BTV6_9MICO|nr:hypothetical protein SAMN05216219_2093 [Mycetocola miduiensis]
MNRVTERPDRVASARATLGTSQLGTSLAVAGSMVVLHSFLRFLFSLGDLPNPLLNASSWLLLLAASVFSIIAVRASGYLLGNLTFSFLLGSLAVVVALDLAAVWHAGSDNVYPTAAIAAGGVLLGTVTLRSVRDVAISSGVLGAALVVTFLSRPDVDPLYVGAEVLLTTLAVMPPLIACILVASYRRMVLMALDRVLIQSTVMAPAFGVSMLESEELAQVDLEVEQLFDDISSGREPLPLEPDRAHRAGELSTVLRRHLIAGRRHTWLHHAIAESDFLSVSVELRDDEALAALLDQRQRDGLLSALWLLMYGEQRTTRHAVVTFGPSAPVASTGRPRVRFPIEIEARGMRRVDVEPATWQHLGRTGRYVDTTTTGALMVVIECAVDSPIDQ